MTTTKLTLDDIRITAPAVFAVNPHPRVSDRYKFFSTAQVMEPLLEAGWFPSRCGQAKSREWNRGYTTHFVALTRSDMIYKEEQIELLLFNNHDGRKRFRTELGIFRDICANGCVWSEESLGELNLRHLHYSPDEVKIACQEIADHAPQVTKQIDTWKSLELKPQDAVALARFGLGLRWPKNPPIQPAELLVIRRMEDMAPTLWSTFNRIQETLLKGGTHYSRVTGKHTHGTTRPVTSIDAGLSINQRLWGGAQALANGLALPA